MASQMSVQLLYDVLVVIGKTAVAIGLVKISWQLWWNRPGASGRDIPGDMGWPVVGQTLTMVYMEPRMFARVSHAKYGPVFKTHILGRPTVFIEHPDDIKKCLLGEERIVESMMPPAFNELLAEGSFLGQHGEEHQDQRGILMRCLATPFPQHLMEVMQPMISTCIQGWIQHTIATNTPADVYQTLREMSFVLSQIIVYGEYRQDVTDRIVEAFHTLDRGSSALPINLPFTMFGKALRAKKLLRAELAKDILEKEAEYLARSASDIGPGYANMLLVERRSKGESGRVNIDGLLSQITTTTSAMAVLLDGLTTRPELVQQIYEEQKTVFGECDALPPLTVAIIQSMPKLDSFIHEILRQRAVANMITRRAVTPWQTHNGLVIPIDWGVYLSFDSCMTRGGTFAAQDQFIPDRFLKNSAKEIRPTQWQATFFGGGARRCPGAELAMLTLKVFVTILVHSATLRYDPGVQIAFKDEPAPGPRPETPLHVYVDRRT